MILSWYEDNWRDRTDGFSLSKYSACIFHAEKNIKRWDLKSDDLLYKDEFSITCLSTEKGRFIIL